MANHAYADNPDEIACYRVKLNNFENHIINNSNWLFFI